MQKLPLSDIVALIKARKTFVATPLDNSFVVKINRYVPYCCTAIHDGSNLRKDLRDKMELDDYARWYEEDPFTGDFISAMPITIVGCDSRFEYDLNRSPETCIYEEAWGKKVWNRKLTPKEKKESLRKHAGYYQVLHAIITELEALYKACVVYDMHSYNYERWDREVPLFNTGTERVDNARFGEVVNHWTGELGAIQLPGVQNTTAVNDVFYGRGYNLEYVGKHFNNTLVLATEVKKVFCSEITGESFPKRIKELQQKLKKAILSNAHYFTQNFTSRHYENVGNLLDTTIDKDILKVDSGLYNMLKGFELLAYVNPINTKTEEKRFKRNRFAELPKFKYAPIRVNPFELKRELSQLRTSDIDDISIRHMYESVINSYFDKIDLLSSLNSQNFLYNSLRYFGRPSQTDIKNANYLLHLPIIQSEPQRAPYLDVDAAMEVFSEALKNYGFNCKMEKSSRVISQVMVLNSRKLILFRPDAKFTKSDISALVEHEIGVHMVTTQNSNDQKLKIFNLGLPVNTSTQEGLAILAEYLSGNITLKRLRKLALRVVICDMMCNGADFVECFQFLLNDHNMDESEAFTLVTRIFRGGGFTKDYLYLSGFVQILKFWNGQNSLDPLLVGKTHMNFYETIAELMERDMVVQPKVITKSFLNPTPNYKSEVMDYIISGLK